MDLLGLVKDQLTGAIVGKISNYIGESSAATHSALGGAVPALLGGIMQQASTTQGAGNLLNLIKSGGHDGKMLDGLGDMLESNEHTASIGSIGTSLLDTIFGNKVSALTNVIAGISGLQQGSASSLLSMAAPILMGVIGKQVNSQGMGLSGLANMLMGQKDAVTKALPAGMGSVLDVDKLGDFLGSTKQTASNEINEIEENTSESTRKWLPWVLLGALLLGALYYFKGCQNPVDKMGAAIDSTATLAKSALDSTVSTVGAIADSTAGTVKAGVSALGDFFKKKLPNGITLDIPQNGIENNLIKFIEDGGKAVDKTTWFNFDRILFDTGKFTLKAESQEQIKNIGEILKAFPSVTLKIGGYTDNTGDAKANMKLSQERANAVMAAIVKEGIDAKRLAAEGYGAEHPEATNDTEEGRAKNRRIAVRVTNK
jgi:OmpA-OmpF porin, OOP family